MKAGSSMDLKTDEHGWEELDKMTYLPEIQHVFSIQLNVRFSRQIDQLTEKGKQKVGEIRRHIGKETT